MGCCLARKKVLPATSPSKRSISGNRIVRTQRNTTKEVRSREVRWNKMVEERYTIFASIGKGEFGHVVRAEHKQSKKPYAIKIIDLAHSEKPKFHVELEILRKVNHKYVIRLHDTMESTRRLYLVMDLATGGELMDRICSLGSFNEHDAIGVLSMILKGLQHLHSLGITHRDLKPQNILYYHPGKNSKIIITDFGLSAMVPNSPMNNPAKYFMKTDCGTIEYMAPEVITRALYNNAVDMWSMGVIVYILLSGRLPFPLNVNILSTLRVICLCKYDFKGEPWNDISDDAKDFIRSLLVYEPGKRLRASDALAHKWIKGKQHSKLNLQRSISSNWTDSCVSLKNEKEMKRHARTTRDSTNSSLQCENSGNIVKVKPTYGAVYRSRDDKLHKVSHGRTKVSEGNKGTQRDVATNNVDEQKHLKNIYVEKCGNVTNVKRENCKVNKEEGVTVGYKAEEMNKIIVQERDLDTSSCVQPQHPDKKVKTELTVLKRDSDLNPNYTKSEEGEHVTCQNTAKAADVQRKVPKRNKSKVIPAMPEANCKHKRLADDDQRSVLEKQAQQSAQDYNGNVESDLSKRGTRRAGWRVVDTTSSRWNLADAGRAQEANEMTERTPLKGNNGKLLPPIKPSVTPRSKRDNTNKLIN